MFDYSEKYVYRIPNFIEEQDRIAILEYMDQIPESNKQREIDFFEEIGNDHIKELIAKYEKKSYLEIIGPYMGSLNIRIEKLSWMRRLELVKWNNSKGLDAHRDGHENIPDEPEFSVSSLIYLNDDFNGGEICFPEYNLEIKPSPGDFIVFPSYFLHEVKEIEKIENGRLRCTIPMFYTFEARKYNEYTNAMYIKQLEDYYQGKGEYFGEQRRSNHTND
jgi:hypothetical protein